MPEEKALRNVYELVRAATGTYDVPDVAGLLKCRARHVRRMTDARKIPGMIRLGRLVRFHKGIVNDWLAAGARG